MGGKSIQVMRVKRRQSKPEKVGAGGALGERSAGDIEFFSGLSDVERRKVERTLEWHNYTKGETILDEHETSDGVYFIVEGIVGIIGFGCLKK